MHAQYVADAGGPLTGADNFVAAFAQTDEGDTVPISSCSMPIRPAATVAGRACRIRARGTDEPYDFDQPTISGPAAGDGINGTSNLRRRCGSSGRGLRCADRSTIDSSTPTHADAVTDPECSRHCRLRGRPMICMRATRRRARPRCFGFAAAE